MKPVEHDRRRRLRRGERTHGNKRVRRQGRPIPPRGSRPPPPPVMCARGRSNTYPDGGCIQQRAGEAAGAGDPDASEDRCRGAASATGRMPSRVRHRRIPVAAVAAIGVRRGGGHAACARFRSSRPRFRTVHPSPGHGHGTRQAPGSYGRSAGPAFRAGPGPGRVRCPGRRTPTSRVRGTRPAPATPPRQSWSGTPVAVRFLRVTLPIPFPFLPSPSLLRARDGSPGQDNGRRALMWPRGTGHAALREETGHPVCRGIPERAAPAPLGHMSNIPARQGFRRSGSPARSFAFVRCSFHAAPSGAPTDPPRRGARHDARKRVPRSSDTERCTAPVELDCDRCGVCADLATCGRAGPGPG